MYSWLQQEIEPLISNGDIQLIHDFQLQPEHIYDLQHSDIGVFIDCHFQAENSTCWLPVEAGSNLTFSSHSMPIESLLFLYTKTFNQDAPPCYFLGIKGESFELGSKPSPQTINNIEQAKILFKRNLKQWLD